MNPRVRTNLPVPKSACIIFVAQPIAHPRNHCDKPLTVAATWLPAVRHEPKYAANDKGKTYLLHTVTPEVRVVRQLLDQPL